MTRILCESQGGSDYCGNCGREMTGPVNLPCSVLVRKHLTKIAPDVTAFACEQECEDLHTGLRGQACEKWCARPECTYTLKEEPK